MRDGEAQLFLLTMQNRLLADPRTALGLTPTAGVAEARSAFLALTKQYHPVKFARCDASVQRLANEVFLALREAHDFVVKNARASTMTTVRPGGAASTTGPLRTVSSVARTMTPPTATPPRGIATVNVARTVTPPVTANSAVTPSATANSAGRTPPAAQPTIPRSATPVTARTVTPVAGQSRTTTGPAAAPPVLSRTITDPAASPAASAVDESVLFNKGKDLLRQKMWSEARDLFMRLVTQNPTESAYRAMLALARGRLAEANGEFDVARREFNGALAHAPGFTAAAQALDDLPPDDPKSSLWSKLRGK